MTESIRISNRENVNQSGKKTSCQIHRFDKNVGAFIFIGTYFVPGWNASDEKIADYVDSLCVEVPGEYFY